MRCKHRRTRVGWFKSIHVGEAPHYIRCVTCRAWLPLGPSNDDGAEVAIEVRAAEIAANDGPIRTCDNAMPRDCEECGWDCWPLLNAMHDAEPAQWAGYLARVIATHGDE